MNRRPNRNGGQKRPQRTKPTSGKTMHIIDFRAQCNFFVTDINSEFC